MRVLAINGSARVNGNTSLLITEVFRALEKEDISTEVVALGAKNIQGCTACYGCFNKKNHKCVLGEEDGINELIAKIRAADALILGSPTYFADITANMKAVIERIGMVSRANANAFRRKLGAAVISVRRAGAIHAFNSLNNFFLISEMVVVGSSYWNIAVGRAPEEVLDDEEGINTMRVLGENLAWLLKKLDFPLPK